MHSLLPHPPNLPGLAPLFRRLPSSPPQSSTQMSLSLGILPSLVRSPVKCFCSGPSFLSQHPHCAKDAVRCDRSSHACRLPLYHCPIVARPTEPRAQPTGLLRGRVVVGFWAGLRLCGCGVLTEAQLEEEHLSGSPEGPSRAEVGTRRRPRWPSSPFSSSTGNSSNLSTRFSSSYSAEAAMGSTSSLRRS